jgi:hypothetical protein
VPRGSELKLTPLLQYETEERLETVICRDGVNDTCIVVIDAIDDNSIDILTLFIPKDAVTS